MSAVLQSKVDPTNPAVRIGTVPPLDSNVPYHGKSEKPIECSYSLMAYQAKIGPDNECLGWRPALPAGASPPPPGAPLDESRPYSWWTYSQVLAMATQVGQGLVDTYGLSKGDKVGFYARNCPWWTLSMLACSSQGLIVVPIYDTLGPNIVEYVCNHSEAKVVLVSPENAAKLATSLPKCSTVAGVIVIDCDGNTGPASAAVDAALAASEEFASVKALTMPAIVAAGAEATTPEQANPGSADDMYCIMYTSGTTGDPKGVTLDNSNIMSSVASAYHFFDSHDKDFNSNDCLLSYLPLSHIFEQQSEALFLGCGGKIGFFTGDIKWLVDDLLALKPTIFIGVPRVYARFQERILGGVEGGSFIVKKLYEYGYARQVRAEENPVGPSKVERSGIWDALVFKKIKGKLLPNVRFCITGSAPLSAETNDFLKVALASPVVQGYGLTETVGGMVCSAPGASVSGTCGGPLAGVEVKLVDLPDMGYMSTDKPHPRGEICVKGPIVTKGYYKNPEATAAAFDSDGFFKTGDVGTWTDDGALRIIDRAKNLFKLSQGEYVSPEAIENELTKAKLVGQLYVYGNSLESTLLGVVVPDIPNSKAWAAANASGQTELADIAALPAFKQELLKQLGEKGKESKLKRYEYIKDVYIETGDLNALGQGFHVDNNLATPTFKLKRPQLQAKYKEILDGMYSRMK